jgi:hypothetical protein
MLDLFWTTLLSGGALLALGAAFFLDRPGWRTAIQAFPRSQGAAYVTWGLGGLWFLGKMWLLGPEDALFGPMTNLVFVVVFGFGWLGAFAVMRDFLAVRGICVLLLMTAFSILYGPAWTRLEPGTLLLKAVVYGFVVIAIWWGVSPFRARDFLGWVYGGGGRPRLVGGILAGTGLAVAVAGLTV